MVIKVTNIYMLTKAYRSGTLYHVGERAGDRGGECRIAG